MDKWYKEILKYKKWAEIEERELECMKKEEVKRAIDRVIDKEWEDEATPPDIFFCLRMVRQSSKKPRYVIWTS